MGNATKNITDRILHAEAITSMRSVHHPPKRLTFRIDPTDHTALHTRVDELVDAMADIHRIERKTFRQKHNKDADKILAQQTSWWIMRVRWAFPHHVIASYFEHHRSTIQHGIQAVQDAADSDPTFAAWLDLLPFWMNVDIEGGRIQAISAVFTPEGSIGMGKGVKTPPRAREGAKKGIVEGAKE